MWTGERFYLFGGHDGRAVSTAIWSYDPATGDTARAGQLPIALGSAAAAWDGVHAYVFGGQEAGGALSDQVYRFDPRTGTVEPMADRLPAPLWRAAAVQAWGRSYLVGGSSGAGESDSDRVWAYTPETGFSETARLPEPLAQAAAVWTGAAILVLGGSSRTMQDGQTSTRFSDRIVAVQEDGSASTETARLPSPRSARWEALALWDGAAVHLAGGQQAGLTQSDRFIAFAPSNGTAWQEAGRLPYTLTGAAGAWTPHGGFVLGGRATGEPAGRIVVLDQAEAPATQAAGLEAERSGRTVSLRVPTVSAAASVAIDWGDGTVEALAPGAAAASHEYADTSEATVTVRRLLADGSLEVFEAAVPPPKEGWKVPGLPPLLLACVVLALAALRLPRRPQPAFLSRGGVGRGP